MTTNNKLADALRNIVNMLRDHPAMQGRDYIDLGIAANNALREYDASLASSPPAQGEWQPIETAPKDNKRSLMLARFNKAGQLTEFDWNAAWRSESESWELPHIVYYYWASENGSVEEPTHWMYQPDWFAAAAPQPAPAPVHVVCDACAGSGLMGHPSGDPQDAYNCPGCNGSGSLTAQPPAPGKTELPPLPNPQVPFIECDPSPTDIRVLVNWYKRGAIAYARAAVAALRQAQVSDSALAQAFREATANSVGAHDAMVYARARDIESTIDQHQEARSNGD